MRSARTAVATVVLAMAVLAGCTPVHGPDRVFSVKATEAGEVLVVATGCPDGSGAVEELAVRLAGQDDALWRVGTRRGPFNRKFVLGDTPPGYRASGPFPALEAGRQYAAGEWRNDVAFRLDDLRKDRLWDGEQYIEEADQQTRCAELLAAAERRDGRIMAFIFFGIPGGFVVLMVLVVLLVLDADRRRDREARAMAIEMPPNPNWPVR